jgi:hypothetical protein
MGSTSIPDLMLSQNQESASFIESPSKLHLLQEDWQPSSSHGYKESLPKGAGLCHLPSTKLTMAKGKRGTAEESHHLSRKKGE